MKGYLLLIIIAAGHGLAAQQSFDLAVFTAPIGWKPEKAENYISYFTTNSNNNSWCRLALYKSRPSLGSVENDFRDDWETLAVTPHKATGLRENEVVEENGWKALAGAGNFRFNNTNATILLTTITGYHTSICILGMTNSETYLDDIENFLSSVDLKKPSGSVTANTPPARIEAPPAPGGYTFNSTPWDDGWTSLIRPDWVEVTKPGIRVMLHFTAPDNISDGWNSLVQTRYTPAGSLMQDYGTPSSGGMAYTIAGSAAREKNTGKNGYVILFKGPGGNTVLEIFADSYDLLYRTFATAVTNKVDWDPSRSTTTVYWNKINDMYGRNKFAIAAGDLTGTWRYEDVVQLGNSSNTSVSGRNLITVISHELSFSGGTRYVYIQGNGSGTDTRTALVKAIYQTYQGRYTATDWELSLQQTRYNSYFHATRTGRVLVMSPPDGRTLFLSRIR